MGAPVGARNLGFFVAAHRADHLDAEVARPLAGDQADAARRGVKQHFVARPQTSYVAKKMRGCEALEHERGGLFVGHAVGDGHQVVRRDHALLGIGTDGDRVGGTIADGKPVHAFPQGDNHPGGFDTRRCRQGMQRHVVGSGAVVDVEEIKADRGLAQAHLARAGIADLHVLPYHDFGSTGSVDADGLRHGYGSKTIEPVVLRPAIAWCAAATSFKG